MAQYLAHVHPYTEAVQAAEAHCRAAAEYAAQALEPAGLSASGYLAGLVHDAGKFTARFQDYLLRGVGAKGTVNHTFAGVRLLLSRYHDTERWGEFAGVAGELLALAAGGHHGLFDCVDPRHRNGFQHRLEQEGVGYEEAIRGFHRFCADTEELDRRFEAALKELSPVLEKICGMTGEDASDDQYDTETAFYSGLLARLLLSAVIEGDRRDTAEFMNDAQFPERQSAAELKALWNTCLTRVEDKLDGLPKTTEIQRARDAISQQCRQAAEYPGGVFRLNVPTGGGKTLASLRYALAHAKAFGKRRIIFTSPLLSILEQNAAVIREYLQDEAIILEHHSNLVRAAETPEELDRQELLAETWDAPVIITTLVQLLNTCFSGKTAAIRRFHALCDSVIVIDEVQTVPGKLLSMFSLTVNFLAEICGATVVLCSATQPCMEQIAHPLHGPVTELVPYDPKLWRSFRRTDIRNAGELSLEQLGGFAIEQLKAADSLLVVCNKKDEAERLFRQLEGVEADCFLLSAAMCPAHRRAALEGLRASLEMKGRKTVCVSTQVIEAGVDISFARVIRLAAGMDSVVQAAGRCNRNGETEGAAPVYLIRCQNESLSRLPDIRAGKDATLELLCEFAQRRERYGGRLDSDESIRYYYQTLYRRAPAGYHDYQVKGKPSLLSLLARNEQMREDTPRDFYFRQAFRTAGALFEVFDQNTTDVIVPYEKGAELIAELCGERAERDPRYCKMLLDGAKPYSVSLYQYQIDYLLKEGSLRPLNGGALGLNGHYDGKTGFSIEKSEFDFLGVE